MDIKLKSKLESSITGLSLMASIIGIIVIGIETVKFIYENYENMIESLRLIRRLF